MSARRRELAIDWVRELASGLSDEDAPQPASGSPARRRQAATQTRATPKFLRLVDALVAEIRRGRLRPGDPLPGSRGLAESLGVHRNTVLAAVAELTAQGWIEVIPCRGTFVARSLPTIRRRAAAAPRPPAERGPGTRLGFDLPALSALDALPTVDLVPRDALPLLGGLPDLRLLPAAALARAYRRVLRARGSDLLRYDDPQGDVVLRTALMRMLAERRGLVGDAGSLLITRGSQMALYLLARALLRPGDCVAVEALGYSPAWAALRQGGAELIPVPVDAAGIDVQALAELVARRSLRAIYLTPHHQYPTTAMLSPGRRMQLLTLAMQHRIAILEDDYDHEFHYEGRPVLPLASADTAGVVVYLGTLSKLLAPGLRIGFVWGPAPVLARLTALRAIVDRQGDHGVQRAVAELLEDGEVERHAWRCRRVYAARRLHLATLLREQLADVLSFTAPPGGMALWARVADDIDCEAWQRSARAQGVVFQAGQRFAFDGARLPFVRLGFACLNESEQREAVHRLVRSLPPSSRSPGRARRCSAR